jgi:hypothetical protein
MAIARPRRTNGSGRARPDRRPEYLRFEWFWPTGRATAAHAFVKGPGMGDAAVCGVLLGPDHRESWGACDHQCSRCTTEVRRAAAVWLKGPSAVSPAHAYVRGSGVEPGAVAVCGALLPIGNGPASDVSRRCAHCTTITALS